MHDCFLFEQLWRATLRFVYHDLCGCRACSRGYLHQPECGSCAQTQHDGLEQISFLSIVDTNGRKCLRSFVNCVLWPYKSEITSAVVHMIPLSDHPLVIVWDPDVLDAMRKHTHTQTHRHTHNVIYLPLSIGHTCGTDRVPYTSKLFIDACQIKISEEWWRRRKSGLCHASRYASSYHRSILVR